VKTKPETDLKTECDVYTFAALKGPAQLRSQLKLNEDAFRFVGPSLWSDPRPAFIYRVLDEVQKAGLAIDSWLEQDWLQKLYLEGPAPLSSDHVERLAIEWMDDEQSARSRKLVEILLDLICFSSTNQPEYYRDYLNCNEFDSVCRSLRDQEHFFGFRRQNIEAHLRLIEEQFVAAESKLEAENRWYLKHPKLFNPKWRKRGLSFSSWHTRYTIALGVASPRELAVLGKSYLHAYGMSSKIHFSPTDRGTGVEIYRVVVGLHRVGLLAFSILMRCHQLLDVSPQGINVQLKEVYDQDDSISGMVAALRQEKFKIGDFVWAADYICEVIESSRSSFGYVSYRVKYLERPPIPDIKEDWFAAHELKLLAKLSFVMSVIESQNVPEIRRSDVSREVVLRLARGWRDAHAPFQHPNQPVAVRKS
jgi:hypothetical protein